MWLLHWKLFAVPILATAWPLAMNSRLLGPFSAKDLENTLVAQKEGSSESNRYSNSSVQKDASCFIRMYGPPGRSMSEEIECPFTGLELLVPGERPRTFRFNPDDKPALPDEIFLAACLEYAGNLPGRAISLDRLAYGENSPGVVFRLSESDMGNRLERSVPEIDGVVFTESFGNRQLQFGANPGILAGDVLNAYYKDV